METQAVLSWIGNHLWTIIIGLSCIIQFTPIKINPWTMLFNWISKQLTGELKEDVKDIKEKIDEQQIAIDDNEKDRIRWEILDFANSCRNGRRHTKEEFQHIITLRDKYVTLLEKTSDTNGVFEAEYQYILELYKERQIKNDFL